MEGIVVLIVALFQVLEVVRIQCVKVKIIVMRHGERMDNVEKYWIHNNFHENEFDPQDENMKVSLPNRAGFPDTFFEDSPLTVNGELNAKSTGEAFRRKGIKFNWILSSPALRAVQTAAKVIEGMGTNQKMAIEPDLFENMHWHKDENGNRVMFQWMTDEELKAEYPVYADRETPYNRKATRDQVMQLDETNNGYYIRQKEVLSHIVEQIQMLAENDDTQRVLLSVHGPSLDALSRLHIGKDLRTEASLDNIACARVTPYCCVMKMVKNYEGCWEIKNVGLQGVKYGQDYEFDVETLLDESGKYVMGEKQ